MIASTATELTEAPPLRGPAAILRGTARGLEIVVDATASRDAIQTAIDDRLAEAPTFFRGSDVRVRVTDGRLPLGALAALDDIAGRYDLRIVEIGTARSPRLALVETTGTDAVPEPHEPRFAAGSAAFDDEVTLDRQSTPAELAAFDLLAEPIAPLLAGTFPPRLPAPSELAPDPPIVADEQLIKVIIGPVRSGIVLEHAGHVIVFGDVNPGAEVRAIGNIIVLGRLRGTAHAGIGGDDAFILSLRLEPQQLRIGRRVTRAGEGEQPGTEPEIAHVLNDKITVERYTGKLPRNLAANL